MTMPEHTDEEKELRDEFEKWAAAPIPDGMGFSRSRIARNTNPDDGYYRDHDFNVAWIAWNAAKEKYSPAPQAGQVTDSALLDWLDEQIVNVIELDDGRLIDTRGLGVRNALRAALSLGKGA